eukprot:5627786-Alexandrium_andersonii.AAC.1
MRRLFPDPRPALQHEPPPVDDLQQRAQEYIQKIPSSFPDHANDRDLTVDPVSYTHLTLPTICSV